MTVDFDEVIMKLFQKASEDGIITDEEGALIMGIKMDLKMYEETMKNAIKKGKVSVEESLKLEEFKNRIVIKAGIVAAKDHHISDDEKLIIKKLIEILKEDF